MEASKVTIQPRTWEMNKVTPKRRKELKQEATLALIRRKPYGKRLIAKEVAEVTGLTPGGATAYLKNLVRDGIITKHPLGLKSAFYTVNEPERVIQAAVVKEAESQEDGRYRGERKQKSSLNLEEQAMQFAWEHPLFNNDLREFVKWFNKKES